MEAMAQKKAPPVGQTIMPPRVWDVAASCHDGESPADFIANGVPTPVSTTPAYAERDVAKV